MLKIHGNLFLHSETGTEGGHWAIQDEKFTGLPAPEHYRCVRCSRVWDKDSNPDNPPAPSFTYYVEGQKQKKDTLAALGGYRRFDKPLPDGQTTYGDEEEGSFNDKWTRHCNNMALFCYENGHERWEHLYPNGLSSYEGLHTLRNGDLLVLDSGEEITVDLVFQEDQYAENAKYAKGLVIHSYPSSECYDFDTWCDLFLPDTLTENKATLIRK